MIYQIIIYWGEDLKNEQFLNLCVIIGGKSVEHEISLISGLQSILNLDSEKYKIHTLYLTKTSEMVYIKNLTSLDYFKDEKNISRYTNCYFTKIKGITYLKTKYKKIKIDCALPIVHGKNVEDGTIAALLEFYDIPYISSGILSSSLSQNKSLTKRVLKTFGIKMLPHIEITNTIDQKKISKILSTFKFPLIIKPNTLGSSIGIEVVNQKEELVEKLSKVLKFDQSVIVEEKLTNFTEYNIACYKEKHKLILSNVEEVTSTNEYLTFDDKYNDGGMKNIDKSNRKIPANISEELLEEIKATTNTIYKNLNFKGVIRIDYLYDKETNRLLFNEVNTIPGSLAFYLYEETKFTELLDKLIKEAILSKSQNDSLINSFDTNILEIKKLKMKK